ncbi:MAG: hypothetical protein ACOX6L_12145 [Syntrophomonadaceae bacterium]
MDTKYKYIHQQPQNGPEFDQEVDLLDYARGAVASAIEDEVTLDQLIDSIQSRFGEKGLEDFLWHISRAIATFYYDNGTADWLIRKRK